MTRWRAIGIAGTLLALSACATPATTPADTGAGAPTRGTLTVLAATSVRDSFARLGAHFERDHPGWSVTFSFGPSSGLVAQLVAGAPADILATASTTTMDTAVTASVVATPTVFARNAMTIVVPGDNPGRVDSLDDLADPQVSVAVCDPAVPCGLAARQVFARAGIAVTPITQERDVAAVLSKVSLGGVGAGIVYVTDARLAPGTVTDIPIPDADNATTDYAIAVARASENPHLADEFAQFIHSDAAQRVLRDAGFAPPG